MGGGVSIFATQLSAITFMAIPARAIHRLDLLRRPEHLRRSRGRLSVPSFFRRLDVTTAYEYLEHRFSVGIRLFGSAQYLLFQFGRMAIVVYLPALALSAVTGIDILLCIGIMGGLCIFYTVLGGVEAVIWSDVIQAFVLLGGAILIIIACVSGVDGGLVEIHQRASAADRLRFADLDAGWDFTRASLPVVILGGIFINLVPYASDQSVVQRYLTTRDESASRRAIWLGGILAIPASILFFGIGTALFGFYDANPDRLVPLEKTDQILPWFLVNEIPSGIAGLVIAGIFAAAMSSLDSSMNSSATALVTDFYRRFLPDRSESHYLGLARWITVVLGFIGTGVALLMATSGAQGIFDQWLQIVGLFGGGLCGLFVLGIFTNRAGTGGAIVGSSAASGPRHRPHLPRTRRAHLRRLRGADLRDRRVVVELPVPQHEVGPRAHPALDLRRAVTADPCIAYWTSLTAARRSHPTEWPHQPDRRFCTLHVRGRFNPSTAWRRVPVLPPLPWSSHRRARRPSLSLKKTHGADRRMPILE